MIFFYLGYFKSCADHKQVKIYFSLTSCRQWFLTKWLSLQVCFIAQNRAIFYFFWIQQISENYLFTWLLFLLFKFCLFYDYKIFFDKINFPFVHSNDAVKMVLYKFIFTPMAVHYLRLAGVMLSYSYSWMAYMVNPSLWSYLIYFIANAEWVTPLRAII